MKSKIVRTSADEKQFKAAMLCLYFRRVKSDGTADEYIDHLEQWWSKNRQDVDVGFGKTFSDLLTELDAWLTTHRPAFLKEFNGPIAPARFARFEQSTGLVLPEDYKLLLSWRDGQQHHFMDVLHPFMGETLMSLAATESTMNELKELLKSGAIDETMWHASWLPFMADRFGNHTCIDLSPESYGEVLLHDHELGGRIVLFNNLWAWLADLLDKLQYLNVQLWESETVPCDE